MLKTQLKILYFFKYLKKTEDQLYLYIIDVLSFEYGWTIEYIENLTMPEILGLLKTIRDRKDSQFQGAHSSESQGFQEKERQRTPSLPANFWKETQKPINLFF